MEGIPIDELDRELSDFLRRMPAVFDYRYSEQAANILIQRLFTFSWAENPAYAHLLFPNGLPSPPGTDEAMRWSLSETQGAVEGIEYTEAARGHPCGHIFKAGEASYQCRTCQADPTCVMCARCFDASDHEGHPVYIFASDGNSGCCDCGDAEAWVRPLHCGIHTASEDGPGEQKQKESSVPQAVADSIRIVVSRCLDYICDVWSCSPEQLRANKTPSSVRQDEKLSRLDPEVYGGTDDPSRDDSPVEYALILWNDEKHTFQDVASIVARACRTSISDASSRAQQIDIVGRNVVQYSTDLNQLLTASVILEKPKLSVTIRSSRDIFRESMCGTIIEWISDISGCAVGSDTRILRNTICEEFLSEWHTGSGAQHRLVGEDGIYDHNKEEVTKDLDEALGSYGTQLISRLQQAWERTDSDTDDNISDEEPGFLPGRMDMEDLEMLSAEDLDRIDGIVQPDSRRGSTNTLRPAQSYNQMTEDTAVDGESSAALFAIPRTPAAKVRSAPRPFPYWREIPAECAQTEGLPPAENLRRQVRLDWFILYDLRMWKQLRISIRNVLIQTVIGVPEFKRLLGLRFAGVFTVLAELHLIADREPDHSLIFLSLQILTVPSISVEIMERANFLTTLMAIIYTFLSTRQVGYPHQVDLTATLAIDQGVVFNRRAQTFYQDMRHLLALDVVKEKIRIEPRYLQQFLDIAKIHQGICPNVRAVGEHLEYEMEAWMSLSNVMSEVMRLCRSFAESFHVSSPEHEEPLKSAIRLAGATAIINALGCERERFDQGEIKRLVRFQALEPFEFEDPSPQPGHWIVRYVVSSEPMSCYHPLHYVLSWLISEAKAATNEDLRHLLHFSQQDLAALPMSKRCMLQLIDVGDFSSNYLLALFDYPIRVCSWMAQTRAGMWVRNGLSLRHQTSQYRNARLRDLTYQRDIFMVQTAFVVCDPSTILATLIDRFDILDFVKGNFESHPARDEPQTIEIAEEFVHLLIVILCDRLALMAEDQEKVLELATIRELVHALCHKPLSYTELKKSMTEKVKEADDQGLLRQVATYKPPEGITDHGLFTLKEEYVDQIDPYLPFLSRNMREDAETVWRQHIAKQKGKDIADVVYEPKIQPIEKGVFKNIHAFTSTPLFAQTMFYFIQYAMMAPTVAPEVQSTRIEQLFQFVLHLTLVAVMLDDQVEDAASAKTTNADDQLEAASKRYSFSRMAITKKATRSISNDTIVGLLRRSTELDHLKSCGPRVQSIFRHLQRKCPQEYNSWRLSLNLPSYDSGRSTPAADAADKELRKKQALERQKRVMQQMKEQQNNFMEKQTFDWGDDLSEGTETEDLSSEKVARFPSGSCILCQEETNTEKLFGTFAYITQSQLFRSTPVDDKDWVGEIFEVPSSLDQALENKPFGVASRNKRVVTKQIPGKGEIQLERSDLARGFPRQSCASGTVSTGCGHIMHFKCFELYVAATQRRHNAQISRHQPEDIIRNEFLCPLCKALGNAFLPIIWKPQRQSYPGPLGDQVDLGAFIDDQIDNVTKKNWEHEQSLRSYAEATFVPQLAAQLGMTTPDEPRSLPHIDIMGNLPAMHFLEDEGDDNVLRVTFDARGLVTIPQGGPDVTMAEAFARDAANDDAGPPPPPPLEPTAAMGRLTIPELKKVYMKLINTLAPVERFRMVETSRTEVHNGRQNYVALQTALADSITAVEIAQRAVASDSGTTFLGKISTQTVAHLRVLSETIVSFNAVSGQGDMTQFLARQHNHLRSLFNEQAARSCGACEAHLNGCERHRNSGEILLMDPFAILAELSQSVLSSNGSSFTALMKLLFVAEISRVIFTFISAEQSNNRPWPSVDLDEFVGESQSPPPDSFIAFVKLNSNFDYSGIYPSEARVAVLWQLVQKYALPFLRKCVLLAHVRFGVDFPPSTQPDAPEIERLSRLLFLPPTLSDLFAEIIATPRILERIRVWREDSLGSSSRIRLLHPAPFELVGLPRTFDTLQDEVMRRKCPSTGRALWDPAICLFCGEIFCSQAVCCTRNAGDAYSDWLREQDELDAQQGRPTFSLPPPSFDAVSSLTNPDTQVGGCWQHRLRCGGPVGIFLHIRKCTILYLHRESGSYTVAPYLDKFGEADPSLRGSLQLFLNKERYERILKGQWLGAGVPSVIARKLEGEMNTGGWETL